VLNATRDVGGVFVHHVGQAFEHQEMVVILAHARADQHHVIGFFFCAAAT
jgi:hypothetical protein